MAPVLPHPSSYRDPSGFVFYKDGILYRQVNQCYQEDFSLLMASGLPEALVRENKLVSFQQIEQNFTGSPDWFCTLQPEKLPFISFPYEWSFDMLKDAALLTLDIAQEAMAKGLMLKDATPYNVQLRVGRMIFIDTLSFERYDETLPWIAYRQFCESFLLPLALMHYHQVPLQSLLLSYPEGIPLPVGKRLLPRRSKWQLNTFLHLHLNASLSRQKQDQVTPLPVSFSAKKLSNILKSLRQAVLSYSLKQEGIWSHYYNEARQREDYVEEKKQLIQDWLNDMKGINTAIDVGCNEGLFSELLAAKGIYTLAADFDHFSVNSLYKKNRETGLPMHPLVIDFSNPSPSIGVNNKERSSFLERVKTDLVVALAVVHHLAIGKNIPLEVIAQLFAFMGRFLIVEFVPKTDVKVQEMLRQKKDIYQRYTEAEFKSAFTARYRIINESLVGNSGRKLFFMVLHEAE